MEVSYWLPVVVQIPCMQASFATMLDGLLCLREGDAGCSVIDIAVVVGQVECRDDGGLQVIILWQGLLGFAPYFEESVRVEVGTSLCSSLSLLKRHGNWIGSKQSHDVNEDSSSRR